MKRWAEAKGYRATVEEPLSSGGKVDVALRREGHSLACEISVTTPRNCTVSMRNGILPASIFARSRMSLISASK